MCIVLFRCFFFFSSRRRHTRLQGDWSSDVCSSDLNGTSRKRTGNEVETSCGMTAAACTLLCAASHPSSRSAFRQRNWQSSRDKKASKQNQGRARTLYVSIPIRCPPDRERQRRSLRVGRIPQGLDPNRKNQNCHSGCLVALRPRDNCAPHSRLRFRKPSGETAPRWAICVLATSRKRWPPHG